MYNFSFICRASKIDKKGFAPIELSIIINGTRTERKTAIERLAHSKLRFIVAVAKIYRGCGLSMQELISAGNEGFDIGCRKF